MTEIIHTQPSDYRAIAAWGRMLRSYDYYIEMEQAHAADDRAPIDAIYKSGATGWRTLRGVENPDTREWFRLNYPDLVPAEWGT